MHFAFIQVTLPTPEASSPNEETPSIEEAESKSTVIDDDETKTPTETSETSELDKTIEENTEDDSAV